MANVQHANLTDPNLHEPKGVAAATEGQVYVADGAGSGDWAGLTENYIDYSDKTKNKFGWIDVSDSQYNSGAPRSISSGVRTQITNNAGASQTDTSRLGALWNTTLNAFVINDLNAAYSMRMTCVLKTSASTGTPHTVDFELETSNGPTIIAAQTQVIKGGNHLNRMSLAMPFYVGSFINNTQLKIYVTADQNISLYDIGFVVVRNYVEQ